MLIGRGIYSTGGDIPNGLIVPYAASGAAPSGWELFSSANGKMIRGAHSGTISIGATTTGSTSKAGSTSTDGSHQGSRDVAFVSAGPPTIHTQAGNGDAAGGHSHTFTASGTAQDVYKEFQLIKALGRRVKFPANALLLGASSLSGLTQYESSTDRFLRANSSYGSTGGSSTLSMTTSSYSTAGSHVHEDYQISAYGTGPAYGSLHVSGGSHSDHSGTITGTMNTKHYYLTAWGNASGYFDLVTNGIAMYESFTPPNGWLLCDGTGGTPDLRQFFIRIGSVAQMGTNGGNNTVATVSGTTNTTGSHNHTSAAVYLQTATFNGYHSTGQTHNHTATCTNVDCTSPSYALAFIMRE